MRSLVRYAVTNAVTRAMLSQLLTKEDFGPLLRGTTVRDAWNRLRKTAGGEGLPEDTKLDPLSIEKHLRESTAVRFERAIRTLGGRPRVVGSILLSRWELDNLEFALRLWHGRDPSLEAFLTYPLFRPEIPVAEIMAAQTFDEIVLALRRTPYFEPLSASAGRYKEKHSIFYVEVALERDYYGRLLAATAALGGSDARDGVKIVGTEIDMLNLSWLARLQEYYEVPATDLIEAMIPGPSALSRQLASPGLTPDSLAELSSQFISERMRKEDRGHSSLERVSLLEYIVREMAVANARRMLAGYPFSIACVFAFFLLLRVELKNLCAVFAGKACGLSENDISTRLYGLG